VATEQPNEVSVEASPEVGDYGRGGAQVLQLVELEKRFGKHVAVDRLTLNIEGGEFVTLLGASGSGKTTTLMMVAGFEQPTAGSIILNGREVSRVPPHRRGLGVVFQSYALFPHMTVRQNVAYPLRMRRVARRERTRRVSEALERVNLEEFADRMPREISGGQQQRVALARALVFAPAMLLMDEPLGALDRKLREQLQSEIQRLHKESGVTIVYVTHDQSEALALSDRIAVMRNGRIEQVGSGEEIYNEPQTAFVADFVGETTFLSGTIETVDADVSLVRLRTGERVSATRRQPCDVGAEVVVAVRPERIRRVTEQGEGEHLDAFIDVTIRSITFLGSLRRYESVTSSGDRVVWSETASGDLVPLMDAGDKMRVGWKSGDASMLTREA
jgi:putative spermidine/putrescine transport system ATP-binding protein